MLRIVYLHTDTPIRIAERASSRFLRAANRKRRGSVGSGPRDQLTATTSSRKLRLLDPSPRLKGLNPARKWHVDNFREITMRASRVPAPPKSAISEVELDRLLDAVRTAIEAKHPSPPRQPPIAANNNQLEWPFILFPEGGTAPKPAALWTTLGRPLVSPGFAGRQVSADCASARLASCGPAG
jgi:hypothetical protein